MGALLELLCIRVCVDLCIHPTFAVVTDAFLAGLCLGQVSHRFSLFAPVGVEILVSSWPSPCSGGSEQRWKVSTGCSRCHFNPVWIPLGLEFGCGCSKHSVGSAYSACFSLSLKQIFEFASVITSTCVCC